MLGGTKLFEYLMMPMGGIGACFIIFGVHPLLFVVAVLSGVIALVTETFLVKPNRRISDIVQQRQSDKTVVLDDMIAGGLTVRLFNLQKAMDRRLWGVPKADCAGKYA